VSICPANNIQAFTVHQRGLTLYQTTSKPFDQSRLPMQWSHIKLLKPCDASP